MTNSRTWTDREAEARFWQLMQRYEAEVPAAALASGGALARLLAALRRPAALRRARRTEREAQALVDRFTVPAPAAVPAARAPVAAAPSRAHSALVAAATLANDGPARQGESERSGAARR